MELPNFEVSAWWARILVGRRPWRTFVRLLVLVPLCIVLFKGTLVRIRVTGHSMEPTYADGRINFINQMAYWRTPPRRGDVVAIQKTGTRLIVLKRITGLPGERVAVRRGRMVIDGEELDEPYARGYGVQMRSIVTLGPDEYFAIGDNREVTAFDTVHRSEIRGKVLF